VAGTDAGFGESSAFGGPVLYSLAGSAGAKKTMDG
jgi:hypothetical protein